MDRLEAADHLSKERRENPPGCKKCGGIGWVSFKSAEHRCPACKGGPLLVSEEVGE